MLVVGSKGSFSEHEAQVKSAIKVKKGKKKNLPKQVLYVGVTYLPVQSPAKYCRRK